MAQPLDDSTAVAETVKRNMGSVAQLEREFRSQQANTVGWLSERITNLIASPIYILAHAAWFFSWVSINTIDLSGIIHFDPYPFSFLGLCLASEAMLLTTFVLMSQRRQAHQADQWAHVALQVSLVAEQETTKMLEMLQSICQQIGLKSVANDKELREMIETPTLVAIAAEMEKAREGEESTAQRPKIYLEEDLQAA
ncbi:MAG TPA: DUF1003 domain-containing protein [Pirellulales bacterium]|nr:DUF1003 domain-containing protein [Pirellulales bacterium]